MGYEVEEGGKNTAPFWPRNPGLLIQGFNVTRTAELQNYFLKHRTNKVYKARLSSPLEDDLDAFKYIKQDRDLDRVRQRYLKLTKLELVDLLVRMEQYIVYQNQHWLKNEFEKYKD